MTKGVAKTYWMACLRMAIAAFLLLVLGLIVSSTRLNFVDEAVVEAIYGLPDELEIIFDSISQIGSIGAFLGISAVLLLLKKYKIARKLIPSGVIAVIFTAIAKQLYATERPFEILEGVIERVGQTDSFGFPSGHTALIAAMAFSLMTYSQKKYKYALWIIVILVAISRIYLGVHTLTDVLGGFLVGYIAAESVQFVINITDKKKRKK